MATGSFFSYFLGARHIVAGVFIRNTCIQYINAFTLSFILLSRDTQKSCIRILNHPLQFDMFMTYIYECSIIIP